MSIKYPHIAVVPEDGGWVWVCNVCQVMAGVPQPSSRHAKTAGRHHARQYCIQRRSDS